MFTQDHFKLFALFLIAAVVHTIGVKNQNVLGAHQSYFSDIGRFQLPRAELNRVVLFSIWVIPRNLQAERQKLHHPALIYAHELAAFGRKHQSRRMTEVHETEMAAGRNSPYNMV